MIKEEKKQHNHANFKPLDLYLNNGFKDKYIVDKQRYPQKTNLKPIQVSKLPFSKRKQGKLSQHKKFRDIEESDGFLWQYKLPGSIKMLIVVTFYNQESQLLKRTLDGIHDNLVHFESSNTLNPKQILVVCMQDGIDRMKVGSLKVRSKSSSFQFINQFYSNNNRDTSINPLQERFNLLLDQQTQPAFPECYDKDLALTFQGYHNNDLQTIMCLKNLNGSKLSSHMWFFQGFCKHFKPKYCVLIDAGTKPDQFGLVKFYETMQSDDKCGGCGGFMGLLPLESQQQKQNNNANRQPNNNANRPKNNDGGSQSSQDLKQQQKHCEQLIKPQQPPNFKHQPQQPPNQSKQPPHQPQQPPNFMHKIIDQFFSLRQAQYHQYFLAHAVDKGFQAMFGFLNVLPGAWSCYRYSVLCKSRQGDINLLEQQYLRKQIDQKSRQKPPELQKQNMFMGEDRLLCMGIFCSPDDDYIMRYVPDAIAYTDPVQKFEEFIKQRRRWFNASNYAFQYVSGQFSVKVNLSKHSQLKKQVLIPILFNFCKLSNTHTYLSPMLFFFTIYSCGYGFINGISTKFSIKVNTYGSALLSTIPIILLAGFVYNIVKVTFASFIFQISNNQGKKQLISSLKESSVVFGFYYLFVEVLCLIFIAVRYSTDFFAESVEWQKTTMTIMALVWIGLQIFPYLPYLFHPSGKKSNSWTQKYYTLKLLPMLTSCFYNGIFFKGLYSMVILIYANCNIHDFSWGTKGLQSDSQLKKQFQEKRLQQVQKLLLYNCVLGMVLIGLNEFLVPDLIFYLSLYGFLYSFIKILVSSLFHLLNWMKCKPAQTKEDKYLQR